MISGTEAILNVYADTLACITVFGLLFFAVRNGMGKDPIAGRLFAVMCLSQMINAVSDGISYYFYQAGAGAGWPLPLRLLPSSIEGLSMLTTLFVWFLYVEHKLYGSRERTDVIAKLFRIPLFIIDILLVVNLFTGFMFSVDEQMLLQAKAGYYIMIILMYFYGIVPIIAILRYIKLHGRPHFFHISPVILPVIITAPFSTFTNFSPAALGISIGTVFLFFSYIHEWRFDDHESGFYNKYYLKYLMEIADQNTGKDYKNAICFKAETPGEALYRIFREDLPNDGELIRVSESSFLIFSESSKLSMIRHLSSLVSDDAEAYDNENPTQPKIGLKTEYLIREKGEPVTGFIEKAGTRLAMG